MSEVLFQSRQVSVRQLCRDLALSYATFQRWRQRQRRGQPLTRPPGPKKLGPLPLDVLMEEVACLQHRLHRTHGTGALYARHRPWISRRALAAWIRTERWGWRWQYRHAWRRVRWLWPNVAWSLDATEYAADQQGRKLILVLMQDLASSYRFRPLVGLRLEGLSIAAFLEEHFRREGPPLFLKRDNGGPFNTPAIEAVLAQFGVLPLNNPVKLPRYNGAIERGIGLFKGALAGCLPAPRSWQPQSLAPYLQAVTHTQNSRPRRRLAGRTAAQAYYERPRLRWTQRERHAIFEWLRGRTHAIVQTMDAPNRRSLRRAWRQAVETWLRRQGLIEVSANQNQPTKHQRVSPDFPQQWSH